MARKYSGGPAIITVSPGAGMSTNAARHTTGLKRLLYTKVMPALGPTLGLDQPVALGAKRYIDVLHQVGGAYVSGKSYMLEPKKLVGSMQEMNYTHLEDFERQEATLNMLDGFAAAFDRPAVQEAASA